MRTEFSEDGRSQPMFIIAVTPFSFIRFPRDGRCIEEIGTYDPKAESAITVDAEKAKQWIKNGAQPTDTVRGLLKKANVL